MEPFFATKHPPSFSIKLFLLPLLAGFADWLFYDQPIGWTPAIFGAVTLGAIYLTQPHILVSKTGKIGGALLIGILISFIEEPELLNSMLLILGFPALVLLTRRQSTTITRTLRDIARNYFFAPFRFFRDLFSLTEIRNRNRLRNIKNINMFSYLIIPLALSVAFVTFFVLANPILAGMFDKLDDFSLIGVFTPPRFIFWLCSAIIIWSLLRPHIKAVLIELPHSRRVDFNRLLSQKSIVLTLVLFNVIFGVQNGLDIIFLWSGQDLPSGMSYATYAQSGAYTLIFTILIAAWYVMLVFRDEHQNYQSRTATSLVYFWIGQNVFLLASAAYRNIQYIDAYALTLLRLSALIWMAIIGLGLIFIVLRIYRKHDNSWLIKRNALSVIVTLYVSCFINFNGMIANYNVRHAREITGEGAPLDLIYMSYLGLDAIPALSRFIEQAPPEFAKSIENAKKLKAWRVSIYLNNAGQWRNWSWRRDRIISELK